MTRRGTCALVALLATFPISQAPAAQPPVFRAATDLVEVDVVVRDKTGRFVSDLAMDDFELQDDGAAQQVQQVYLRVAASSGWDIPPAGVEPAPRSGQPLPAPASVAPRVFVVVLDDAHMTVSGFKRAQAAALTLFSKHVVEGDFGGVVANGRIANNRLTRDRDELVKAIKAAHPSQSANARTFDGREWPRLSEIEAVRIVNNDRDVLAAAVRRACEDDPTQCRVNDPTPDVQAKAGQMADRGRAESNQTLQLLITLMNGLEKFDGRKTVLLLSEGFLTDESWPLVQQAVSLAVDTGGFVVRNTNQFDRAIGQIADEASNYYVLGYVPAAPPDGTFHRISVRVRRPGVTVRARRGYTATPRPSVITTASARPAATSVTATDTAAPTPINEIVTPERPAVAATTVAVPAPGSVVRLRPDASKHLDLLLPDPSADRAAAAGWEAYQRGDVATARASLAIAAANPAAEAWVHYALGQADYALRQYPDAVSEWEKVRRAARDFEPVYFDLVDGYLQLKQYDNAVRLLREEASYWPKDPEVFNALGVVHTVRGALDEAITSFEQAIVAAPGEAIGYFNLAKGLELRYFRTRRYVQQTRRWLSREQDRTAAIDNYQRYVAIGGPYAVQAREGLTRLNWVP